MCSICSHFPADEIGLAIAETTGFKKGDFKSAVLMYAVWVRHYPQSKSIEDAEYQQAGALWMAGSYEEAVTKFSAFLTKYPGSHYKQQAQSTLVRAKADQEARLAAIANNEKTKSSTDPLSDDLLAAESKMRQGDYVSALKLLGRFRGKQSTNTGWGHAWYCYGLCLRMLGEPEKALQSFEEVIRHANLFESTLYAPQCRRAIADLWFEDFAKPEKALPVYQAIRAALPEGKPDLALEKSIALALIAMGRGAEAKPTLMEFRKKELSDPFRTRYWDNLIALCDAPAERRGIKTAAEREAETYSRIADIHFTAENWEKAECLYKKSQRTAPKTETAAFATMQTARCLAYQNQRDRALKTYNLFLSDYSQSLWADDALLKAGVLCTGPMGDSAKGAKYFQKIIDDYPKGDRAETAFYYLATLALWGQNWEEAERLHKEFLKQYPESLFLKEVINDRLPAIAQKKIFLQEPKKNTES